MNNESYIVEKKYGPLTKRNSIKWGAKEEFFFPPQFTDKAHQPIETCDFFKKHVIFPRNLTQPLGFPGGSEVKAPACKVGDPGSIPGSGRSPGEGKWQPTPVFLPGKSHGQRPWQATVHPVTRIGHNLATKPPPHMYMYN